MSSIHRSRVLVIDGDPLRRRLLRAHLAPLEYEIHEAADGPAGIELARGLAPDVVLCERDPVAADGLEWCRGMKSDPALRGSYLVLIVEDDDPDDAVRVLDAGADDVIVSPHGVEELRARVRVGVRTRALMRDLSRAQHERALLSLATTMGHEINNPLTALFGHMELILRYIEAGDAERLRHHVRRSGEVAGRIAEVANRLGSLREVRTTTYLDDLPMLDLVESGRST